MPKRCRVSTCSFIKIGPKNKWETGQRFPPTVEDRLMKSGCRRRGAYHRGGLWTAVKKRQKERGLLNHFKAEETTNQVNPPGPP
jgi:hypothetical protein